MTECSRWAHFWKFKFKAEPMLAVVIPSIFRSQNHTKSKPEQKIINATLSLKHLIVAQECFQRELRSHRKCPSMSESQGDSWIGFTALRGKDPHCNWCSKLGGGHAGKIKDSLFYCQNQLLPIRACLKRNSLPCAGRCDPANEPIFPFLTILKHHYVIFSKGLWWEPQICLHMCACICVCVRAHVCLCVQAPICGEKRRGQEQRGTILETD